MENNRETILSEVRNRLRSIRELADEIERQLALLKDGASAAVKDEAPAVVSEADTAVVSEADTAAVPEAEVADVPAEEPVDFTSFDISGLKEDVPASVNVKEAIIDRVFDRQAWRTDMPGSEVSDIRSAISLNDRILFINTLFGGDPALFQDTLTELNGMDTLDGAIDWISGKFKDWDMSSDVVYRFIMTVRRKIRK